MKRLLTLSVLAVAHLVSACGSGDDSPRRRTSVLLEVSPQSAAPGETVILFGKNLGAAAGIVLFGEEPAEVSAWSATEVHLRVPELAPGVVPITVKLGKLSLDNLQFEVTDNLPTAREVVIQGAPHYVDSKLKANLVNADRIKSKEAYFEYAWFVNGQLVEGAEGDTLSGRFSKGDSVHCTATPRRGSRTGTPIQSAAVLISNRLPSVGGAYIAAPPFTSLSVLVAAFDELSDLDGDSVLIGYRWSVNGVPVFGQTTQTLGSEYFSKGDLVSVRLTPSDGDGTGTAIDATPVLIADTPPELIRVTLGTGPFYATSVLSPQITANDGDGETVTYTYRWFVNGELIGSTGATLSSPHFARDATVIAEVTPFADGYPGAPAWTNVATISNSPPTLGAAFLGAGPFRKYDTLTPSLTGWSDPDNDAPSYAYQWFRNGLAIVGATTPSLDGSEFNKHDTLYLRVTPTDGLNSGTAVTSNFVQIVNSAPSITGATLAPSPAYTNDVLTVIPLGWSDPDGDAPGYRYQWYKNFVTVAAASLPDLAESWFTHQDNIAVRVTPWDGEDTGFFVDSANVVIANSPPVLTSAYFTEGPYDRTQAIYPTIGYRYDPDGGMPNIGYRWYKDGVSMPASDGFSIIGLGGFARGTTVTVALTPMDTSGLSGATVWVPPVTIQNAAPGVFDIALSPLPLGTLDTATVNYTLHDPDGDTVITLYNWYVNDVAVAGETAKTLSGDYFSRGDRVKALVTPFDGARGGMSKFSAEVTVANSGPIFTSVSLGGPYTTTSEIEAVVVGLTDPDLGDFASLSYRWFVNGVTVPAETGATLAGIHFAKTDSVAVEATATDGTDIGSVMLSAPVVVDNSPPTLAGAAISPGVYRFADSIVSIPGALSDADDIDAPAVLYQWLANGAEIPGQTSQTLAGSLATRGQTITVRMTPHDGVAAGAPVFSNPVTIANTPPALAAVSLNGPYRSLDTVIASPSGWIDTDGDTPGYQVAWYVDGDLVPDEGELELDRIHFARAATVAALVTPFDGLDGGNAVWSDVVTIQNSPPVAPIISLAPTPAAAGGPIWTSILVAAWDPDGDPVSYRHVWYKNGIDQGFPDTQTSVAAIDYGDLWKVVVTPHDGFAAGPSASAEKSVLPVVTAVAPGAAAPDTVIAINGSGFGASTGQVSIGGLLATIIGWSDGSIQVEVPPSLVAGNTSIVVSSGGYPSDPFAFTVKPSITAITPDDGALGSVVEITGLGFGHSQGASTVRVSGVVAGIVSWSNSSIFATIPGGVPLGANPVQVRVNTQNSNLVFFEAFSTQPPLLYSAAPTAAVSNSAVTLSGAYFGAVQGTSTVYFGGVAATIDSWADGTIVARVPSTAVSGLLDVWVLTANGESDHVGFMHRRPWITSVSPGNAPAGDIVKLRGSFFGATSATVTVSGVSAAVWSWSDTAVEFLVPAGVPASSLVSLTTIDGLASNTIPFARSGANQWVYLQHSPLPRKGHTAVWTGQEMIVWGGGNSNTLALRGERYNPATDTWLPMSMTGQPSYREFHTANWTGNRMLVWGGANGGTFHVNGAQYDPATDTWSPISAVDAPSARRYHSAVWSGSKLIVWGGHEWPSTVLNSGGVYDPVSDAWYPTALTGAPEGRYLHVALWVGDSMLILSGGTPSSTYPVDNGRYYPLTNTWSTVPVLGAPNARIQAAGAWTGTRAIVWGGFDGGWRNTGAIYDPKLNQWVGNTTTVGAPAARYGQYTAWSGEHMYVWGGNTSSGLVNTGGRYHPATNTWSPMPVTDAPVSRNFTSMVATGSKLLVWGGQIPGDYVLASGGQFDLATQTWERTSVSWSSSGRHSHALVWTGSEMIAWGGQLGNASYPSDGERYNPATDTWLVTSSIGAPPGRKNAAAVWDGSHMLVWGGENAGILGDGARYDPVSDSWSSITAVDAPAARTEHLGVWTGSELLVYGGRNGGALGDGFAYDPVGDAWYAMATTTLTARYGASAVYSGSELMVWGGFDGASYLGDGGRYDPAGDSWLPITTATAPSPRAHHTATWVNDQMIVWGGFDGLDYVNTGARFYPAAGTWSTMSTISAPATRAYHTAVWANGRLVIHGGRNSSIHISGGLYNPATDQWQFLSWPPIMYLYRYNHRAVWTGSAMLVWGGRYNHAHNDGAIYYP